MNTDKDYPNSGILFREDNPKGNTPRDYKGTADVTCPQCSARSQFWLSAWIKQGRKGKFMSLAFKDKDGATAGSRPRGDAEQAQEEEPF